MHKSPLRLSVVALLLFAALPQAARSDTPDEKDANRRISNGVLSVGISDKYAGAVSSLVYDGVELVNNYDRGRQMQVAWIYNDLGEPYNPTEAGSDADGRKPTSTSRLLRVMTTATTLATESHPAYWNRPSPIGNSKPVTNDVLKKRITLGFRGDPHVIVFDTEICLSPELTGPAIASLRIESPTLYAAAELSSHYRLKLEKNTLKFVAPRATMIQNRMNERILKDTDRKSIPVLSSPDGRHAVGFYAATANGFWSYYTWDVPSEIPHFGCNKMTAFFLHPAKAGTSYNYRTFVIVGSLDIVKASAEKLRENVH
ncbi:MAG: hypothetical protein LLG00_16590 [Planctomycetaceae bacterium]|nr:hypothetical protein [Planctomycetaceae bacterium]